VNSQQASSYFPETGPFAFSLIRCRHLSTVYGQLDQRRKSQTEVEIIVTPITFGIGQVDGRVLGRVHRRVGSEVEHAERDMLDLW
jgi:hypothetical protein